MVTFISVIMFIQAALAVVAAVALVVWWNDLAEFLEGQQAPATDGALAGSVISEMITAALLFFGAYGLLRGSRGWRLFIAIIEGIAMSAAVYTLIAHHVGGYVYRAVFTLFIGAFVLWALYGNEQSQRYFDAHR